MSCPHSGDGRIAVKPQADFLIADNRDCWSPVRPRRLDQVRETAQFALGLAPTRFVQPLEK
jgi:hypothetical protein